MPEAVKAVNLGVLAPYLQPRSNELLVKAVEQIEAGIAAGMVPNKQFSDAKDSINRAVNDSAEAFLKNGPAAIDHHQSAWWLAAYHGDAFISGAHNVPSALKRAQKIAALKDYAAFIANALLPLHGLLASAKPLIKKRGELPKALSPKQQAEEGERMTCQCCRRKILAKLGSISHHGYERPNGWGYQTASCMGAKRLPFEVDRAALGEMIGYMRAQLLRNEKHRAAIKSEKKPIVFNYESQLIGPSRFQQFGRWVKWPVVKRSFDVSRKSFEEFKDGPGRDSTYGIYDFDAYKSRHVEGLSNSIKNLRGHIAEEQKRYDSWVQTAKWKDGQWVVLKKEKARA